MGRKRLLFLNLLIGVIIYLEKPILPNYLQLYNIDVQYSTYLFASLSFFIMIFAPFWGDIGDIKGRKGVLIVAVTGMAASQFVFGYASTLWIMVVSRCIQGVFLSGVVVSFMAYFNDNSTEANRARLISLNIAFIGLGIALGSLIGGAIGQILPLSTIYFIQSVLFLILGLVIHYIYPKSYLLIDEKRQYVFNLFKNIRRVSVMGLLPGMLLTMTFSVGIQVVMNYLEFYLSYIEFNVLEIGAYVFGLSIIGVIGNATITHKLLDRFNEFKLLVITLVIGGISLLLTAVYPAIGLFSFMLIFALVYNKFKPITTQIIHEKASDEQGVALGVRETLIHFGMLVGSIVGGLLIANPISIFYFSSIIMFICALGFNVLRLRAQ